MIHFENGSDHHNEIVMVQGHRNMPAKDVPIGACCWKIGNKQYYRDSLMGGFEKCLGRLG